MIIWGAGIILSPNPLPVVVPNFRPERGCLPVNDPLIARFANACGATAPLDLRVDLAGGNTLAEGTVNQPFTLVGRDDACDVTLSDPEINLRHAWLQVIGGRVFAIDLGSRTGLGWPSGTRGSGWLDVGVPVHIGPFLLRIRAAVTDRPSSFPANYDPLASDTNATKIRPSVTLEFRNGKRLRDRWTVNRLITLVGRSPDCKIHLTADDISAYHCGLVSTRTGLWVVDLSGRGVVVNGERMRVAPLGHGTELWVGRFLIGCHYPSAAATPSIGRIAALTPPAPIAASTDRAQPGLLGATEQAEDEALFDSPDPITGLPNSHILADAFDTPDPRGRGGPPSNPIQVSGSGPSPGAIPVPPGRSATDLLVEAAQSDETAVVPLLRRMAELHGQTSAQFQQFLTLLEETFAHVRLEYLSVMRHELNRILELDTELAALQAEVAHQALVEAAAAAAIRNASGNSPDPVPSSGLGRPPVADKSSDRPGGWIPPSTPTPLPDTGSSTSTRLLDRVTALQQERNTRWQALITLFTGV